MVLEEEHREDPALELRQHARRRRRRAHPLDEHSPCLVHLVHDVCLEYSERSRQTLRRPIRRAPVGRAAQAHTAFSPADGSVDHLRVADDSMAYGIDLYWLPLGAGGWFVRLNGLVYEA